MELVSEDRVVQAEPEDGVEEESGKEPDRGRHSGGAELRCVALETGKPQWSEPGFGRSSLLYVDGHFIVQTERGGLALFRADPEKAEMVTKASHEELLSYPTWNAPILSHGRLYVRGARRLVAFELIPHN